MPEYQMTEMETKFADIIWKNMPIKSPELVKLCEEEFKWKKSTTYTMLKRLSNKGIFENNNGTVNALICKAKFYSEQSKQYVNETFGGSLPKFLAAFSGGKQLSDKEISELQKMIDNQREASI